MDEEEQNLTVAPELQEEDESYEDTSPARVRYWLGCPRFLQGCSSKQLIRLHRDMCGARFGQLLTTAEKHLSLSFSDESVQFKKRVLANKVCAWSDKKYTYRQVPTELTGAVFFAGPMQMRSGGILHFVSPKAPGTVYIWSEPGLRSGGLPQLALEHCGVMNWKWGQRMCKRIIPLQIYKLDLSEGDVLEIPVTRTWVGGLAFQELQDCDQALLMWVPPQFMMMSGDVVPEWDHHGVRSVKDVRARIAGALGQNSDAVELIGNLRVLKDSDPLPSAHGGSVSVLVSRSDGVLNGS